MKIQVFFRGWFNINMLSKRPGWRTTTFKVPGRRRNFREANPPKKKLGFSWLPTRLDLPWWVPGSKHKRMPTPHSPPLERTKTFRQSVSCMLVLWTVTQQVAEVWLSLTWSRPPRNPSFFLGGWFNINMLSKRPGSRTKTLNGARSFKKLSRGQPP